MREGETEFEATHVNRLGRAMRGHRGARARPKLPAAFALGLGLVLAGCAINAASSGPIVSPSNGPSVVDGTAGSSGAHASSNASDLASSAAGFVTYHLNGMTFSVPAGWHLIDPWLVGTIAFTNMGTFTEANVRPCCHMDPNTFVVSVTSVHTAGSDLAHYNPPDTTAIPRGEDVVVKQNMPIDPSAGADIHWLYLVGHPGCGYPFISVSAGFRGPDIAVMERDMDAFVETVHFDTPVAPPANASCLAPPS